MKFILHVKLQGTSDGKGQVVMIVSDTITLGVGAIVGVRRCGYHTPKQKVMKKEAL